MNVYILEIDAVLKENKKDKKLINTLSKWDSNSPLYYYGTSHSFELGTDCSKSDVFIDKRKAIKQSKRIYERNYDRIIVKSVKILTIKIQLSTPLNVRYSEIVER